MNILTSPNSGIFLKEDLKDKNLVYPYYNVVDIRLCMKIILE